MINLFIILFLSIATITKYDVAVDAATFYRDYKASESKADIKYKDKKIFLHGIVKERSSNLWTVYLVVDNPNDDVAARIDDEDNQILKVPAYNKGDKFDMICIGSGIILKELLLLHCRVP